MVRAERRVIYTAERKHGRLVTGKEVSEADAKRAEEERGEGGVRSGVILWAML